MKRLEIPLTPGQAIGDRSPTLIDTTSGRIASRKPSLDPLYYVLVVEDNLINQKVLQRQLMAEGCAVDTANNGQEALDKIMQSRFMKDGGAPLDAVLMDMEMPIMGGVEATRRIRNLELEKLSSHVPIIGISANARPEQSRWRHNYYLKKGLLTLVLSSGRND